MFLSQRTHQLLGALCWMQRLLDDRYMRMICHLRVNPELRSLRVSRWIYSFPLHFFVHTKVAWKFLVNRKMRLFFSHIRGCVRNEKANCWRDYSFLIYFLLSKSYYTNTLCNIVSIYLLSKCHERKNIMLFFGCSLDNLNDSFDEWRINLSIENVQKLRKCIRNLQNYQTSTLNYFVMFIVFIGIFKSYF